MELQSHLSIRCSILTWCVIALTSGGSVFARTIEFSGRTWTVRSGFGGPGPNAWSDDPASVWVDGGGRLHLTIRNVSGMWHCAEVLLQDSLGYGEYRFRLATDVTAYDPRIVTGLFTYLDDLHEIDIELSRWSNPLDDVGQFVVQPYDAPGHLQRFPVTLSDEYSTHWFRWLPGSVRFQSSRGLQAGQPPPVDVIRDWTYSGGDVPTPSVETARINLWLFQGQPPGNTAEAELVVESFEFIPATATIPALGPWGFLWLGAGLVAGAWVVASRRQTDAEPPCVGL